MRFTPICLMLTLSLSIIAPLPSSGEDTNWTAVGLRAGWSASDNEENFEQYEVFATYGLPWSWQWPSGWGLSARLDATGGVLCGGGETGFVGSIGPSLALSTPGGRIWIDIGVSPTYLSKSEFGREDFGGAIQFSSHLGMTFHLGRGIAAGYRIQHMSNAGIKDQNPGLSLHMLALSYHF